MMNILKFMLAGVFAVCILASVTACKHTENAAPYSYEGFGETRGELSVPMIKWMF